MTDPSNPIEPCSFLKAEPPVPASLDWQAPMNRCGPPDARPPSLASLQSRIRRRRIRHRAVVTSALAVIALLALPLLSQTSPIADVPRPDKPPQDRVASGIVPSSNVTTERDPRRLPRRESPDHPITPPRSTGQSPPPFRLLARVVNQTPVYQFDESTQWLVQVGWKETTLWVPVEVESLNEADRAAFQESLLQDHESISLRL